MAGAPRFLTTPRPYRTLGGTMPTADEVQDVLRDVRACVEIELENGSDEMDVRREVLESLGSAAPGPPPDPLQEIAGRVAACTACDLHKTRTRTVPGQGSSRPDILFVGEGPGADEDRQGLAFVGRAGKLLTRMIEAMGYTRDEVFIGNIVKCRPPANRTPLPEEMDTCLPYLKEQIAVLRPRVIVALGATAVKGLIDTTEGITRVRGRWQSFEGIDLMPTYHPAYLLRNPSAKRQVWDDLQEVLARLGREPPARSKPSA